MDAHLIAQGYTLEDGPVEGVRVRMTWRPEATHAQMTAIRADPLMQQCVGWAGGLATSRPCEVAAWLIQHPEAPIEWTIEVAP